MGKLICPNCGSLSIRRNTYASDNIFGFSKSEWFDQTGRWICENCGQFIKSSGKNVERTEMTKIRPNLQSELFKYSLQDLCKEAKCEIDDLKYLKEKELLSFELDKKEYEIYEVNEASFLTALLRSGLPLSRIKILLQKLDKPYAYSNICYDFVASKWVEKSITPENDISVVGDYIGDYVDYLGSEEKTEELENILKATTAKLKELKGQE